MPDTHTQALRDRWHSRDYPVLVEAARAIDDGGQPDGEAISAALAITSSEVDRALEALIEARYVDRHAPTGPRRSVPRPHTFTLTERGRRAVGIWPSGEDVDALIDALRQAEDAVEDPEERKLIRRAAGAVGSVSRDVMVDVIAAVATRQAGLD